MGNAMGCNPEAKLAARLQAIAALRKSERPAPNSSAA